MTSCFSVTSVLPHRMVGPSGVMTVLVLVSVAFTVFAIGIAPPGGLLGAPLGVLEGDCGQATRVDGAEAEVVDADEAAVARADSAAPPEEHAVTPRPRRAIPVIAPTVLRAAIRASL
ncbi:hypothetical protein [Streptomyces sp. NPDC051546]|uniref:hypothetical protein n=1 Tax=Streptomyces sp. NPDC051546 TaxID=3365655 RepID=UPI0037A76E2E